MVRVKKYNENLLTACKVSCFSFLFFGYKCDKSNYQESGHRLGIDRQACVFSPSSIDSIVKDVVKDVQIPLDTCGDGRFPMWVWACSLKQHIIR